MPEKRLSSATSLLVAVLSLGLFGGGTALMVKAGVVSSSPLAFVLGDEDEDEEKDDDKDETAENKDKDKVSKESEKKKLERERESEKKKYEQERESAKKKLERERESLKYGAGRNSDDELNDEKNNEDEEEGDENEDGDDFGDLMKKVSESEKEIFEKQHEGVDATAALSRVGAARTTLDAYKAAIAAGNMEEAEKLAREIKKLARFAVEEDLHDAKKSGEQLKQAQEKIAKAKAKLALLAGAGGSTESFVALLAGAEAMVAEGNAALSSGDFMKAGNLFKEAKGIANRVKDMAENALYALGGSDDDFDDDHSEFAREVSDDLDDIAEIESDDDRVKNIRRIAMEQKQSGSEVATAVQLVRERSALAKFLFGSDDMSLATIEAKIAENSQNALALRTLAQSSGDADIQALLVAQAERIEIENEKIRSFSTAQADSNGVFGWLIDLFR